MFAAGLGSNPSVIAVITECILSVAIEYIAKSFIQKGVTINMKVIILSLGVVCDDMV